MKTTPNRMFRALCASAAFWLAASPAVAGTWTYNSSNNRITHSGTAWVLNVSRSGTSLTVTGVYTDPSAASALPLDDAVSGYQITGIGNSAFSGCSKLTGVTIPGSVTSVGRGVFAGCENLTGIYVASWNLAYRSIDGVLFSRDGTALLAYPGGRSGGYTIPGSVTSIGDWAFGYCGSLTSVTIPDGVTSIGWYVFYDCTGLTNVVIPDSVTSIGYSAFSGCSKLTSLAIPDSVTSIGSYAFASCTGLTGVTIGNGVTSFGSQTFYGCSGLTSVAIGNSVTSIGYSAFHSCSGLTSVMIPDSVTSIDGSAFHSCSGLTSVAIGNSVTNIGDHAFYGCTGLTGTLMIPDSVASIGDHAFEYCRGLTSVAIGNSVTSIGRMTFSLCFGLTNIMIPDSVTSIGDWAFYNCIYLTRVAIGSSVTNIGVGAFTFCYSLKDVFFEGGYPVCGDRLFSGSGTHPGKVTVFVRQAHAQEWEENVDEGSFAAGNAVWQECPVILTNDQELYLAVNPATLVFGTKARSKTAKLTGNVIWIATRDATWLTASPATGFGNATLTITAEANTSTEPRSATITIIGAGITNTVTVTQSAQTTEYLPDPLDFADIDIAPIVTTAYEGFAYDEAGTVRGTVTLSAKAAVKADRKTGTATTNWTFTAKAVLQSATVSFSAKAAGVADRFAAASKKGEALDVTLGAETFYGTLEGGKVGGTLSVAGARNAFADRKDAAAQGRLAPLKGLYNVALLTSLSGSLSEPDGRLKGECAGYLALTVGNAGAVKLAGKLADGTAVSGAAKLLEGLNEDGWYAVALYKPLYAKKGFIGGLLWLNPEDGLVRVDADYGWCVDWVCGDVKKGVFERELDVAGGAWTGGGWGQPPYRFGASVPEELPPPAAGLEGAWAGEAFPRELAVTVSGAKWSLPKATAPKKAGTAYDYSGANPSGATLSFTAKTGLFKGTFKLYWDGADAKGKAQHKTASVSYTGVLVPTEDGGLTGLGAGAATVNKQKVGIPVFLTE